MNLLEILGTIALFVLILVALGFATGHCSLTIEKDDEK